MKKRISALFLALLLALSLLPATALAALPDGWWPVWKAYQDALASGNEDTILACGDDVIAFYAGRTLDADIAGQLYMVRLDRLDNLRYENRSDYAAAIANAQELEKLALFLGYDDMVTRCRAHLGVLAPEAGVYAVSYTQSNTYGSKIAAASGTFYGSVIEGHFNDRSIVSHYILIESQSVRDFAWQIDPLSNGTRVLQFNFNFSGEGNTARALPSGAYDANLIDSLKYINTLRSPALIRIGAEMDVWTVTCTPAEYIAAYRHVAALARQYAPNAELIWSPCYASAWNVDTEDFYPGDDCVDWVGVSLYYSYQSPYGDAVYWLEAMHLRQFADPLANAAHIIEIARAHNKPVAVTEGGATKNNNEGQGEAYAVRQVAKEFSTLTMRYPEVKSVVYFDKAYNGEDYTLTGSLLTAAESAVASNPTLIAKGKKSAGTYVPLEQLSEVVTGGKVVLGATGHTYKNMDMSAVYVLDGKTVASTASSPNQYVLDTAQLTTGKHKLEVTLSDGHGYSTTLVYTIDYNAASGAVACSKGFTERTCPFTDVKKTDYCYDAVLWALDSGVTTGATPTTFEPNSTCTRGQIATFLWRAVGKPEPTLTSESFTDVDQNNPDHYFYKPVLWALEKGITNGTSDTTFEPDATCTNAHILTFLWRGVGSPNKTGAGEWYEDAVRWAEANGILAGIAGFDLTAPCPRGDAVTFIYRAWANK